MKLYHGTSLSRSKKIEEDKKIIKNADLIYDNKNDKEIKMSEEMKRISEITSTTPGFIYLTNNPAFAFFCGNRNSIMEDEDYFVVYEVEIDENVILPDIDEMKVKYYHQKNFKVPDNITAAETLKECESCRVDFDLPFEKFVKRKIKVCSTANISNEEFKITKNILQNRNKIETKKIIEELEWEEVK